MLVYRKFFEKRVLRFQFSFVFDFYNFSFYSLLNKKFIVMKSLLVHLKCVRDIFFDYKYFGILDTLYLSDSFLKMLVVFDFRKKVFLKRPFSLKYLQKKRGFFYFFTVEDIYQRLFLYNTNVFLIPLTESLVSSYLLHFRPFRNGFDLFKNIKTTFYSNNYILDTAFTFKFVFYYKNINLPFWFLYNTNFFSKNSLRFDNFSSDFFLINIVHHFYSFVFFGLVCKIKHYLINFCFKPISLCFLGVFVFIL